MKYKKNAQQCTIALYQKLYDINQDATKLTILDFIGEGSKPVGTPWPFSNS